jgi:hypothetical protein
VTATQLEARLAERLLGWRTAPDRFLVGQRRWIPRWRFQPLRRMEQALELLQKAGARFTVTNADDGTAIAEVTVAGNVETASATSVSAAITLALSRAMGIDTEGLA